MTGITHQDIAARVRTLHGSGRPPFIARRASIAQHEIKGMDSHAPSVSARPKFGIANGNEKFGMLGERP